MPSQFAMEYIEYNIKHSLLMIFLLFRFGICHDMGLEVHTQDNVIVNKEAMVKGSNTLSFKMVISFAGRS